MLDLYNSNAGEVDWELTVRLRIKTVKYDFIWNMKSWQNAIQTS